MANTQDCSVGLAVESTYGTGVTAARWLEFVSESFGFNKQIKQGMGLRVGGRVARSARRVAVAADAGGDVTVEATSKGLGLLWQACLGAATSTLVSGTTYQQVFTLGDAPSSLTVQKGIVETGGTVDPITFLGCMVDSWELDFANADIVKLKTTFDAKDVTTATAYAAPSYPTAPNLFHFAGGTVYTGTLTAPTATALASGVTPLANVRSGNVKVDRGMNTSRYNMIGTGRKSKPLTGAKVTGITGKLDVEYDSTTFRDAFLADTPLSLVLQWTAGALSTGVETLQVVIPEIKFDGELVKANAGDISVQGMTFAGLDNLTAAQPIWIVARTSDAAL